MNIGVIGVGKYSLAITKQLAKNPKNNIVMWTENDEIYKEFNKTHKLKSIFDVDINDNITVTNELKNAVLKQDIISKFSDAINKADFSNKKGANSSVDLLL